MNRKYAGSFHLKPVFLFVKYCQETKAATILRLLGNETNQFNIRGKKSEPGIRKQLHTDVKSTIKNFFVYTAWRHKLAHFGHKILIFLCFK